MQTSTGRKHNPSNLRCDILAPAVDAANVKLADAGIAPIGHLDFHARCDGRSRVSAAHAAMTFATRPRPQRERLTQRGGEVNLADASACLGRSDVEGPRPKVGISPAQLERLADP
jgi:hypothetical protein